MSVVYAYIKLNNQEVPLRIERKKIKHTYLRVRDGEIRISTHPKVSLSSIHQLIQTNEKTIIAKLFKQEQRAMNEQTLYYLGQALTVQTIIGNKLAYKWLNDTTLVFAHKLDNTWEDRHAYFYKSEANNYLPQLFDACFSNFNKYYPQEKPELAIRKMKSRYGTCYYKKNKVILNQQLIRYREAIITFVIYHELSHFVEPNHSQAFYHVLAQFVPNHKELRKEINKR